MELIRMDQASGFDGLTYYLLQRVATVLFDEAMMKNWPFEDIDLCVRE